MATAEQDCQEMLQQLSGLTVHVFEQFRSWYEKLREKNRGLNQEIQPERAERRDRDEDR